MFLPGANQVLILNNRVNKS